MEIIGIPHFYDLVDVVDGHIAQNHPGGIKSLMVELPPTLPEFIASYRNAHLLRENFFSALAEIHEERGTRIIYGDRALRKISAELFESQRRRTTFRSVNFSPS
jgi:hypothetical protein